MMDEASIERYALMHPFELIFPPISLVFGKDYRLNELPKDAAGNVLYKGDSEFEYQAYVQWLADYLYHQKIEPNERQIDLCRIVSLMDKDDAMYLLGMYAACHESYLIDIEAHMAIDERLEDPCSFSEEDIDWINNRAIETRKEYDEWAKSNDEGITIILCEDLSERVSHKTIRQHLEEEAERKRLCDYANYEFCDMPWRIPLSVVLKDVKDKKERVRLLKVFVQWHTEYIYK